jgi:nicotinate-nucleotide adenylyltransferase
MKTDGREKIGVFGGSFDPVHLGHLGIAEEAREIFGLDRVIFVPAALPPHKRSGTVAPAADRLAMVALAIAGNPRFSASDIELHRAGPSYTIDTLDELQRKRPRARLYFIVGADSLAELHKWRHAAELVRRYEFIIIKRPGTRPPYAKSLEKAFGKRVAARLGANFIKTGIYDISATAIRKRVRDGKNIRYLVPPAVERYIFRKGLYRGD